KTPSSPKASACPICVFFFSKRRPIAATERSPRSRVKIRFLWLFIFSSTTEGVSVARAAVFHLRGEERHLSKSTIGFPPTRGPRPRRATAASAQPVPVPCAAPGRTRIGAPRGAPRARFPPPLGNARPGAKIPHVSPEGPVPDRARRCEWHDCPRRRHAAPRRLGQGRPGRPRAAPSPRLLRAAPARRRIHAARTP